jgi:hypothetical protein
LPRRIEGAEWKKKGARATLGQVAWPVRSGVPAFG